MDLVAGSEGTQCCLRCLAAQHGPVNVVEYKHERSGGFLLALYQAIS